MATRPGTQRPRLSPVERIRLAQRVAVERARRPPTPWYEIARRERIPSSTVRYIYSTHEMYSEQLEEPFSLLDETLLLYGQAIELLADEAANGDSSSARVGATRSMLSAAYTRLELLAAFGKLPRTRADALLERDYREVAQKLTAVLLRHNLSTEVLEEMQTELRGTTRLPPASRSHDRGRGNHHLELPRY